MNSSSTNLIYVDAAGLDRVSQSTGRPTHSSRANLQTTASRAVSIDYRISRTSGGQKLVVARSYARISDQPSAPHRAIKPDRSGTCNSRFSMQGWELYSNRLDKDWGAIDCISFVLMQERNLTEALTAITTSSKQVSRVYCNFGRYSFLLLWGVQKKVLLASGNC